MSTSSRSRAKDTLLARVSVVGFDRTIAPGSNVTSGAIIKDLP